MRKVEFCFGDTGPFNGFTDDTHWNGFLNVEVSEEVHKQVKAALAEFDEGGDLFSEIEKIGRASCRERV